MRNSLIFTALIALLPIIGFSQIKISSPLSNFGFGQIQNPNHAHVQMGGDLSASYTSPDRINFVNPSSLSTLKTTVYEGGIWASNTNLTDGNNESRVWAGNLAHLSLAFPLQNKINAVFNRLSTDFSWGMGFELRPSSLVGYETVGQVNLDNGDYYNVFNTGDGSIYHVTWNNGWGYKNVRLGLMLGYQFGKTELDRTLIPSPDNILSLYNFPSIEKNVNSYRGFIWNLGAGYDHVLSYKERSDGQRGGKEKYFSFGATYHSNWKLRNISSAALFRRASFSPTGTSGSVTFVDTLFSSTEMKGNATLPSELQLGVRYVYHNKISLGVNYSLIPWENYRNDSRSETEGLNSAFKLSVGGSYIPNAGSVTSFFDRVKYSAGLYYNQDPRQLGGEQLKEYGANIGVSLPFFSQRQTSYVDIGLNIGQLKSDTGYEETYFKLNFGFSLTDNEWFLKRKYD